MNTIREFTFLFAILVLGFSIGIQFSLWLDSRELRSPNVAVARGGRGGTPDHPEGEPGECITTDENGKPEKCRMEYEVRAKNKPVLLYNYSFCNDGKMVICKDSKCTSKPSKECK